ncbi:helix-turn-helix domain-containing protein [Isoptericola sp. NPDC019482]|uniref:helix-turn-helix domain-containing protein n=1 Tax=Isoptericola sp. NPDC019482 TaxID=3154688 RepID=UPI0034777158
MPVLTPSRPLDPDGPSLITKAKAAALLSVNERTVERMIEDGRLAVRRVGPLVRIDVADLDRAVSIGARTNGGAA